MEGSLNEKQIIYSAHETTMVPLLAAYGFTDRQGPPYASVLITELHHDDVNGWWVKVFYRNDTMSDPHHVPIRNCPEPCTLNNFKAVLEPFTLVDKKNTCYPPDNGSNKVQSTASLLMILVVYFSIVLCST